MATLQSINTLTHRLEDLTSLDRPPPDTPGASSPSEESEEHDIEAMMMEEWYDELRMDLHPTT
eukprot:2192413-Pyramimonas_sp.AAC.1